MKKILALAAALMVLLASAAFAEKPSTVITADNLELSWVVNGDSHTASLSGIQVRLAAGVNDMTPTFQVDFFSQTGQQLGATAQIVDNQVLLSMGSVSSVFVYDLSRISGGENLTGIIALAIRSTASLGGVPLAGLLTVLTEEGENGARVAGGVVPAAGFRAALENALEKADALDAAEEVDFAGIRRKVSELGDTVRVDFSYDLGSGAFSAIFTQEDWSINLSGVATISNEPFEFAEIDMTADRVDVMNLKDEDIQYLNDELSLMAVRLVSFAGAAGLGGEEGDEGY